MSFIEIDGLGDDYEDKPVPEGEYLLRVTNIQERTAKDGKSPQIMVMLKVEDSDYPDSATIFNYLTFPNEEDDAEKRRTKMRMNTRFLKAFRVPFEKKGFNAEDIVGCEATLLVTQSEFPEGSGIMKNNLNLPPVAE
jgi:hypothetical protein